MHFSWLKWVFLFLFHSVAVWPGDTLSCQDRLWLLRAGGRDQAWHSCIGVLCLVNHFFPESPQPQWRIVHQVELQQTLLRHTSSMQTQSRINTIILHNLLGWKPEPSHLQIVQQRDKLSTCVSLPLLPSAVYLFFFPLPMLSAKWRQLHCSIWPNLAEVTLDNKTTVPARKTRGDKGGR